MQLEYLTVAGDSQTSDVGRGLGGQHVIEQNELLTLLVAASVLIFVVSNWRDVKSLPVANVCILAFLVLFLGLAFTVLEGLFCGGLFNVMEHVCYGLSSLLLASWVWLVFAGERRWR